MTSFSTGGYKDLCSAQVSNEQPSCCQSLALTSYLGRALIKGLAGKCMLQVLFRAVKMSRAGLIKLALTTSISLFYFKFHNLIWFLWFFFSVPWRYFQDPWIFYAMLTLCNGTAGYLTFQFCACAHTHIGRLRRKSVSGLFHRWKILSKHKADPLSASACKHTRQSCAIFPPLLSNI